MNPILKFLQEEPIVAFAILLAVILIIPPLFERIRLPGLVGLLLAGVILGPHGLNLLQNDSEAINLLSDIGLLYLMFVAGLEVDIEQFQKVKFRSIGFGSFTFLVPLIMGTLVGRIFGFNWIAAVLLGSLFASHTLLAYPIISRLGVVNNEAVTVTIGATIFTDIGALLVLAVCVAINAGDFTAFNLVVLLGSLILYSAIVLFGFDRAGREFFRRSGDDQGNQFLFVLLAIFLAAVGAELIGIEKIVGAFLAGLAVNDAVGESPVKEKVVFVGSVLFIPIFFVNLGLLIDLPAFISSIASIWLTLMIVGGLIASKFLAALLAKLVYRYNWQEFLTMWSLSLPQVGATLAAALVGYRAGILSEAVLNSVIVLMLVTATLGPLITARSAKKLALAEQDNASNLAPEGLGYEPGSQSHPFTVVVPIYNPRTQRYLMELAALLAKHEGGRVVPLAITLGRTNMDAPRLEAALNRGQELLQNATELSQEYGIAAEPLLRIDDSVAQGINRASREQNASLVVMGWSRRTGLRARLFGNVIDEVLWGSHCPVAVTRLLDSPRNTHRILVPIDSLNQQAVRKVRFAHILAETNQAQVTLLHVCDRRTSPPRRAWLESQIALMVSKWVPKHSFEIRVLPEDDVVRAVVRTSQDFDLVILRSQRYRTEGGVAISDVTTQVVHQLKCSIIVLGEPHYGA